MADVKISQLPAAASAVGTMEYPANNSGTTQKVTGTQIITEVLTAPSITGGATVAGGVTVSTGGAAITGDTTITGNLTNVIPNPGLFKVRLASGDLMTVDQSGIVGTAGAINALNPFNIIAGGDWWFGYHLGANGSGYNGLWAGLGAPTFSTFGRKGGLYEDATNGTTYTNCSGSTQWAPTCALRSAPTTQTADYVMLASDTDIIFNGTATITLTLLAAATYPGRELYVRTIAAQTVASNASNVVPLVGGGASTAILAGTAGKWARLVSDATNWQIMAAGG